MAIKFALKMGGENVRTMEELRAAFAILEAVEYVENGKLVKWLKNHDEDALAQQVEALDPEDDAMPRKLCELIGVPYDEAAYQAALEAKDQDGIVRVAYTGCELSKATLQKIKDIGYEVTDGRSFDILIVGDMATNSKKAQIARAKGIPMMLEVDFLQQMDLPWKTEALEGVTQSAKMTAAVRPTEIVDVQDAVVVEEPKAEPKKETKKEKPPVKTRDDGQWRGKYNNTTTQTKNTSGPRKNKESFYERITPKNPGNYIPWFHGAFAWTSVL